MTKIRFLKSIHVNVHAGRCKQFCTACIMYVLYVYLMFRWTFRNLCSLHDPSFHTIKKDKTCDISKLFDIFSSTRVLQQECLHILEVHSATFFWWRVAIWGFTVNKGLVIKYRGGGPEKSVSVETVFVDPPLNKGWKSQWPTPLHLAESGMTPPPVIVVISIRAICMLYSDMTVGHYRSYGTRTAAMSWIMWLNWLYHSIFNQNLRSSLYSELPTWLNPKTLKNFCGYGPKTSRAVQGQKKFFGPLVGGSGGMLSQKILKVSVLRLAENAFPTF